MMSTSRRGPLLKYPKDTGGATKVAVVTMKLGILLMGGYDITVLGCWSTSRKAEQYPKEGW